MKTPTRLTLSKPKATIGRRAWWGRPIWRLRIVTHLLFEFSPYLSSNYESLVDETMPGINLKYYNRQRSIWVIGYFYLWYCFYRDDAIDTPSVDYNSNCSAPMKLWITKRKHAWIPRLFFRRWCKYRSPAKNARATTTTHSTNLPQPNPPPSPFLSLHLKPKSQKLDCTFPPILHISREWVFMEDQASAFEKKYTGKHNSFSIHTPANGVNR
jgi:hypothetical protein